jgi:hypothetical protein
MTATRKGARPYLLGLITKAFQVGGSLKGFNFGRFFNGSISTEPDIRRKIDAAQ